MQSELSGKTFRNIYILESRSFLGACRAQYNVSTDLVLTYDLGLYKDIKDRKGNVFFLDHLVDQGTMQKNNFLIYEFFKTWNLDDNENDIFSFKGIDFGFSFRVDIWNDFTFYLRTRLCLETLRNISFDSVYVGVEDGTVVSILNELSIQHTTVSSDDKNKVSYAFPIFKYMHENTRSFHWKSRLKDVYMRFQGSLAAKYDRLFGLDRSKPSVFIHEYHPTRKILEILRESKKVRVVVERISATSGWSRYLSERPVPLWGRQSFYQEQAADLLQRFCDNRCKKLVLDNGSDVTNSVYALIENKVEKELANQQRILDNIIKYVDKSPVALEVLIGNIGRFPSLLDCVCKKRGVPSYLIINGLLGPEYQDEAKYATVINAYSKSIQSHYFKGMDNTICLGDPRMDAYAPIKPRKQFNKKCPTITIGASGFNPVDLNSYVAVEFDFLYDVLNSLSRLKQAGYAARVIVKVRPNGYREQYETFVAEYFSEIVDEIIDVKPMRDVLEKTDFYISIYSQTLFEASCMGIPVLYYKKDTEIMAPPFDGKSELVTVDNIDALVVAVRDAYAGHSRFDSFLERSVMEKYIGPLDGGNLDRNLRFIESMLVS